MAVMRQKKNTTNFNRRDNSTGKALAFHAAYPDLIPAPYVVLRIPSQELGPGQRQAQNTGERERKRDEERKNG